MGCILGCWDIRNRFGGDRRDLGWVLGVFGVGLEGPEWVLGDVWGV